MSHLKEISSNPTLRQFALGAAQDAIQPIAAFIAPTVDVPTQVGQYKVYTEKNRFRIPSTLRAIGGRATEISFDATDATYNCQPHALDFPVDNLERVEAQELEDILKEGATAVAEIAALAHEKTVIDKALVALGAGTGKTWNASADPVDDIDGAIIQVIKAAKYGSLMGVGVLFGVGAWRIFKNHAAVRGRYVVGNKSARNTATPTEPDAGTLFMGTPEIKTSFMVYDTLPEGLAASMAFLLDATVLIFARKVQPSRRDPSFMKTFRLASKWMVPGAYMRDDGRVEVAKFDWSEDVEVTNASAGIRLNITTA